MTQETALETLIEERSDHGPVLVLLHGRGSDERDLFPLGPRLHPDATTVSVRAPFPAAPWGYGPGYAWYQFLGGTTPESRSFERGQDALVALIDALPARLGRSDPPLVLGGFSQGGTSSLAFMMRNPGRVRGVLVFSGFLADHPSVAVTRERARGTPIFWGHGTADPAVPYAAAEAGWQTLVAAGATLEARTYRNMGHTIGDAEMADAKAWLGTLLPGDSNSSGVP